MPVLHLHLVALGCHVQHPLHLALPHQNFYASVCMSVAAAAGIKEIIILDRPNPIGGRVRGPLLQPAHASGIGASVSEIRVMHSFSSN